MLKSRNPENPGFSVVGESLVNQRLSVALIIVMSANIVACQISNLEIYDGKAFRQLARVPGR